MNWPPPTTNELLRMPWSIEGPTLEPDSYVVNPDQTVDFDPHALIGGQKPGQGPWWAEDQEEDWRNS